MHFCGGVGGIRTHGPIAGTHAFQACRFDHSRTSPNRVSRGGILTRGLMTGKVTTSAHHHGIDPPGSPSNTTNKSSGGAAMRTLIGQGILVVLLVTAVILSPHLYSLHFLSRPDSFAASLWRNSPPTHQSVTHVRNNSPPYDLSTIHTSAKTFDEMGLSLPTTSTLLISGSGSSTCAARVACLSIEGSDYPCHPMMSRAIELWIY
jgi:hypothetical protein